MGAENVMPSIATVLSRLKRAAIPIHLQVEISRAGLSKAPCPALRRLRPMKHNYLRNDTSGDHWAAGLCPALPGRPATVIAQLQSEGEQVRIALTPDQAIAFAQELLRHAEQANSQ